MPHGYVQKGKQRFLADLAIQAKTSAPNTKCAPLPTDSPRSSSHTHTLSIHSTSTGTFLTSLWLVTISESVLPWNYMLKERFPLPQGWFLKDG